LSLCLILNGLKGKRKLCIDTLSEDRKGWETYEIADYMQGFLVFLISGYEWWSYVLFNPESKILVELSGRPVVKKQHIYTADNYYSEGFFEFVNVEKDKRFRFDTFKWELTDYYEKGNYFYFAFKGGSWQSEQFKFIKMNMSNGL
jgi:hypothetical protein